MAEDKLVELIESITANLARIENNMNVKFEHIDKRFYSLDKGI